MPTKIEKDAVTGTETTGHEWDGIKELNTPLPKWWVWVFYATIVYAVIWWLLFPSWPGITGYFGGIVGSDQRVELAEEVTLAKSAQAAYLDRIDGASLDQIQSDPDLLSFALAGGEAAFADNCAPCHGLGGAGQDIYPTLADDAWIWGGTLDDIQQTIAYGIRNDNEESRYSEMPAFGPFEMLSRDQVDQVATFVMSLSGSYEDAAAVDDGASIFAEQCAACHGEKGEGMTEVGAPALNDQIWLYGSDQAAVVAQVWNPRHGVMPAWTDRLDEETIKILTVYVHSLGGGQ
jgi:cytochrome c oxidase cbb3-type subunit 3